MVIGRGVKSAVKYSIKQLSKTGGAPPKQKWTWDRFSLDMKLKWKNNRTSILVCLSFVLVGFVYYSYSEGAAYERLNLAAKSKPPVTWLHVLLVACSVRAPYSDSDLSSLYQLTWPIFLEVIVFGFLAGAMLDRFNPVVTSRLLASQQSNHSVIVGYSHLSSRMVDYCRTRSKPYVVVVEDPEVVKSLLDDGEPVVVGSTTSRATLALAQVEHCLECFVLENNLQRAIVTCFNLRALNANCRIYIQVFDTFDFENYFSQPPFSAFTFSTSQWAVKSLAEWDKPRAQQDAQLAEAMMHVDSSAADSDSDTEPLLRLSSPAVPESPAPAASEDAPPAEQYSLVIGGGHCALRFVHYLATQTTSRIIAMDDGIVSNFLSPSAEERHGGDASGMSSTAHASRFHGAASRMQQSLASPIADGRLRLLDVKSVHPSALADISVSPRQIRRVYICWGSPDRFPDAMHFIMAMRKKHVTVPIYVRVFEEELAGIFEQLGAAVFSTSLYAFRMLTESVGKESNFYVDPERMGSSESVKRKAA